MNKTILIADDEYGFRYPISIYLKNNGFNVDEASNKDEIYLKICKVDLLMMDIIFPKDREGIEIVKEIRNIEDEKVKNIPVIFYSILDENTCLDIMNNIDFHPYRWLQKPFEFEKLGNMIKELLML